MTQLNPIPAIAPPGDEPDCNSSGNPSFESVIQARFSRREMLSGTAGAAAMAVFGAIRTGTAAANGLPQHQGPLFPHRSPQLGFPAVAKNLEDAVTLPKSYSYDVLYALGDPISPNVLDYHNDGTDAPESFAYRAGDHHDGMYYFGLGPQGRYNKYSSDRGLLVMNHEAITPAYLHPTGQTIVNGVRTVPEEVLREFYAHGVTRYGIGGNGRELWATVTPDTADNLYGRWNAMKLGASADGSDDYRNVANTYGWVVEIDPFDPKSTPKKRTALGRFGHEGAELGPVRAGEPIVFYMGDDARNEYVYKYVSNEPWDPRDAYKGLAAGDKYLDNGKLYVAQFLPDGFGQWLELTFGQNNITPNYAAYPFADQADVLINARHAADAAGATKMDRPEWAAVNPKNGEVYFTLTNTNASSRPINKVDAANPRFYNDKRTNNNADQKGNPNGHVIRFAEDGGYADALSFTWDVYLFGARATADTSNVNLSHLNDNNDFSSPDGAWFSRANPGLLWIQTDDGAYTDVTNCMMLAAVPGKVGDGAAQTVVNVDGAASQSVTTYVGKTPENRNLRRFLVGPKQCEITGIAETPDGKTLFVNIQHPGEDTPPNYSTGEFGSHWPGGGFTRPRSATIAITRDDDGVIGS